MRLASLLGATLCLSGCAATLEGHLSGPKGEPVTSSDARVNIAPLAPNNKTAPVTVAVEGDGSFKTNAALAPGVYLVEALVPGYALGSQRVTVGEGLPVDLTLKPLPKMKASAVGANGAGDVARGEGGATLTPPEL